VQAGLRGAPGVEEGEDASVGRQPRAQVLPPAERVHRLIPHHLRSDFGCIRPCTVLLGICHAMVLRHSMAVQDAVRHAGDSSREAKLSCGRGREAEPGWRWAGAFSSSAALLPPQVMRSRCRRPTLNHSASERLEAAGSILG